MLLQSTADIPGGFVHDAAVALIACVMGFLGAVAVFRSRFVIIDAQHAAFRHEVDQWRQSFAREIDQAREHDKKLVELELKSLREMLRQRCDDDDLRYRSIERRQLVALELTANLARKMGVHHRAIDALPNILGKLDDDEPGGL